MAVDTLLNNRYAISDSGDEPLGAGGMAAIYAGEDTETGQEIAAKTLLPAYQGDKNRRDRFRREAQVLKAVQGPQIVDLVDVIDNRHGSWILMERLHGETLRDKLEAEGAFRPSTVNQWLSQVGPALDHMHRLGYVHLDITPQNLFLTDDGDVKLIDFGIAQKAYAEPARDGNKLLGTATYISPEHGSGRMVTPASDVYSLGCVVFELLTDRKVFSERGDIRNDETISLRQEHAPELPTHVAPELDLPAWVDSVVGRALLPNPLERYPSVTAFAEEFNARANPPFLKFSWPKRAPKEQETQQVVPMRAVPIQRTQTPELVLPEVPRREPSRPRKWLNKELRNARKAIAVFALLMVMIIGAPLMGGSPIMDWLLGAVPGSSTEVVNGNWYLRSGPATETEVLTLLMEGTEVRVTGNPVEISGDLWWPVRAGVGGQEFSGWAHDDGIARTWLMNRAAGWELLIEGLNSRWDSVIGLLPG